VAERWRRLFEETTALFEETGKPAFWPLVRQLARGERIARGIHGRAVRASLLQPVEWKQNYPVRFTDIDPAFWLAVDAARWGDRETDRASHTVTVMVEPFARIQTLERYAQIQIFVPKTEEPSPAAVISKKSGGNPDARRKQDQSRRRRRQRDRADRCAKLFFAVLLEAPKEEVPEDWTTIEILTRARGKFKDHRLLEPKQDEQRSFSDAAAEAKEMLREHREAEARKS
jgi:hypothetical protein